MVSSFTDYVNSFTHTHLCKLLINLFLINSTKVKDIRLLRWYFTKENLSFYIFENPDELCARSLGNANEIPIDKDLTGMVLT